MDKFNSSINGYNIEEVNAFVDEMTEAYSNILDKLKQKDLELERLKKNNLSSGEDIVKEANKKAENIIKEANDKAAKIVNDAINRVSNEEIKLLEIQKKAVNIKKRMKMMLLNEVDILDDIDDVDLN